MQEDHYEEAEGRIIQRQSPPIHFKIKLVDLDKVAADEAKFSKTCISGNTQNSE